MAAMTSSSIPASIPPGEYVPTADQRIVLHGLTWDQFQTLLVIRGERRYRMAYLDGVVEIMGASRGHEGKKSMIGRLLEHYCLDIDIPITPYGSWHLDDKSEDAAAEPDECYVFVADPRQKEWPDLAIEVVWTKRRNQQARDLSSLASRRGLVLEERGAHGVRAHRAWLRAARAQPPRA